jgi:S1-C subfamily serine protease
VGLVEAKVKRIVPSPRGQVIETSVAVLPERQGGPVLDIHGHVIGVALHSESSSVGEIVRITPNWVKRAAPAAAPQPASEAAPAPPESAPPSRVKSYQEIEDDRRKRLEEAVRRNVE